MEDSVKLEVTKEKSTFERAIIEAFKQKKVSDVYEKLLIAYEELPNFIEEIKGNEKDKNTNFILNLNIIDKISRIIERSFVNINILISKIFNIFLNEDNIPLLSDNPIILINLSNQIMIILEIIKTCDNYNELIKKSINFMKYLINNSEKYLSNEQTEIINNLQNVLSTKLVSPIYVDFKNYLDKEILVFCKGETFEEKEKGLENLNSYFYKLNSLNEQFDILCQYGQDIIKGIISKPNPSFIDIYFKLSYFFISFLYNFIYKIKLSPNENSTSLNISNENIKKINEQYYILDSMEENIELSENLYVTKFHGKEYHNIKFLDKALYELDDVKNILLKYTNIFSLCISILNCLILFEDSFKSQFACFLMLKRLYFIFPKYRKELTDLISTSLTNLISFDEIVINESKEPYESFLLFLLQNGEEDLKERLKERLIKKKNKIKKDYLNQIKEEKIEQIKVENDIVYLSDFNLHIGCPINIEVASGDEEQRLIEVKYPNSLLYIGFNLPYYDINFHLIKYCPNIDNSLNKKNEEKVQYEDHQYFYEIFSLEKTQGAKIILFIKNPGIYKALFDNKYSWFKSKLLRFRCTILKEMNSLNISPSTSNDEIKFENINKDKDEKKEENNNEINIENEEKKEENNNENNVEAAKEQKNEEDKKNVKIAVKFGNSSNIPNIDLGDEDLNDIDPELK